MAERQLVRSLPSKQQLVLPYNDKLSTVITTAKRHNVRGRDILVMPHKPTESKILHNLGYKVSSPFMEYYNWCNTTPYKHQKITSNMLVFNDRAYVLNDMGSGKSLSVLYAYDYLRSIEYADKMLVVAPLSTLNSVWEREVFRWMPHLEVSVLHGTKKQRLRALNEPADIYIINHDGLGVIFEELKARKDIDTYVVDELSAFKNAQTNRWKTLNKLIGMKRTWGLTGRPIPQGPTDAYGQIKLLTPASVPKSFRMFQSKTMVQVSQFKWVPKRDAYDTVFKAMQPAVRYALEDCTTLPPVTHSHIKVSLSAQQKQAYDELMKKLMWQYGQDEVTAANEGVKLSKLLQICSGFVYMTSKQKAIDFDNSERISALIDILNATRRKAIVFLSFKHGVTKLHKELVNQGFAAEKIFGETPKKKRDDIYARFQHEDDIKVLVAHPATMAHGLTLTAANVVVWFSPAPSLEIYEQANARVRRPSQTSKQYIIHLYTEGVESRVNKRLANNQKVQGTLLEMFEEQGQ